MKKITKEYEVYTYDELSKEAKQKAINEYINSTYDYPFLEESLTEFVKEELKDHKITAIDGPKLFYSLSYCQGDGLMFEGTFEWKNQSFTIKHTGHYYHSYSKQITWNDFVGEDKEQEEEKLAKEFEAIYHDICKKAEKAGYEEIEYQQSEEYFQDICEANEWTFLSDGEMFNE